MIARALVLITSAALCAAPPVAQAQARRGAYLVREGIEIALTNRTELSSKTVQVGDRFDLVLAEPVKVGTVIVVPSGMLAAAEIASVEKNGHVGKSGKIEVRILYLKVGETHVPLQGQYYQEGQGGTAGTIGATVVAGPFGLLVKGKSAIIKPGTQMRSFVKESVSLSAS